MVIFSFTTGNLFIEYLKIDGETFIWTVAIDLFPVIREREDITTQVLYNRKASAIIHRHIDQYEDFILHECMHDYSTKTITRHEQN